MATVPEKRTTKEPRNVSAFCVYGTPGPQGSKSFRGMSKKGHAILTESSAKVKPWREAVVYAARLNNIKHTGPVAVDMIFTVAKPKSAPKSRVTFPDRKPDVDKLCRSTFDALTQAGAIEDDARIVYLLAAKVFPNSHEDALDVPGAVIRITSVLPQIAGAKR